MSEESSETISIEEALNNIDSGIRNKHYLEVDMESFGTEDIADFLRGASEVGPKNFKLSLEPSDESQFQDLVEYIETALEEDSYGFTEYAVCPREGLNDNDRGSPYSKIILNRISYNHGMSLAVSDEKLYQI